jgi:hypothetical protein
MTSSVCPIAVNVLPNNNNSVKGDVLQHSAEFPLVVTAEEF